MRAQKGPEDSWTEEDFAEEVGAHLEAVRRKTAQMPAPSRELAERIAAREHERCQTMRVQPRPIGLWEQVKRAMGLGDV